MTLVIDLDRISDVFARQHHAFATAEPFPHVVLDDLFDADLLRAVAAEYPDAAEMERTFSAPHEEGKGQTSSWAKLGPRTTQFICDLNSGDFLAQLEELTGIDHLISDAKLEGGGMHRIGRGGHLGIHADFTFHADNGLRRRVNLLVYLNEDWDEAWGGQLELWDLDMTRPVVKVPPVLGRTVVFATTSTSWHGHPDPMTCPPDRARKSIALYYYSNDHRDDDLVERDSTAFQVRAGSTEDRRRSELTRSSDRWARFVKRWIPPGAKDLVDKARGRHRTS